MSKVLRLQGVVRLVTHFEFGKQDELWSTVGSKYMIVVDFGKTGIVSDIFKEIF